MTRRARLCPAETDDTTAYLLDGKRVCFKPAVLIFGSGEAFCREHAEKIQQERVTKLMSDYMRRVTS